MEGAFGWFGELLRWFAKWIPRLGICRATHAGVRFRHGSAVRAIEPGLYVWWPAVTEVLTIPVVRQSANILPQTLVTKDGVAVLFSITIIVEIEDVVKALACAWDIEETIAEFGGTAAVQIVASKTFDELRAGLAGDVAEMLRKQCRKTLKPFGVNVLFARFTDFAPCNLVARVVGSSDYMPVAAKSKNFEETEGC